MKNHTTIVFAIILASTYFSSVAQTWMPFNETPEAGRYMDVTSIRKNGENRTFWMLTDLAVAKTPGVRSVVAQGEMDCKGERMRTTAAAVYAERMAKGSGRTVELGSSAKAWGPIVPGSDIQNLQQVVCQ